jgi:hypothetical protein
MKNYALIENGLVVNVVVWDGKPFKPAVLAVPPDENGQGGISYRPASGWAPPEGTQAVPIPEGVAVGIGYGYVDGAFVQPRAPEIQEPAPATAESVLAERSARLADATLQIAPLEDLILLGQDTEDDAAKLLAWKQYRADVGKVQTQPGFPEAIVWPERPEI